MLFGIQNCDTVKKARAYLLENGIEHSFHDFKKDGVPAAIAMVRLSNDPTTYAYSQRRQAEGKTKTEALRCLKRYTAREVYNALPKSARA